MGEGKRTATIGECIICGKEFKLYPCRKRRFCSKRCARIYGYKHQKNKFTDIELKVAEWLREFNIDFQTYVIIKNYGVADFLLPNKTIIEADGDFWHSQLKNKTSDARKDFIAGFSGYEIIRLKGSMINNHPRKCKNLLRRRTC